MRISYILFVIIFGASSAAAESLRDRVSDAVSGVGALSVFSDQKMKDVVVPYKDDAPEAGLSPGDFDTEEQKRITTDDMTGRAFAAHKDSALSRPEITIDPKSLNSN